MTASSKWKPPVDTYVQFSPQSSLKKKFSPQAPVATQSFRILHKKPFLEKRKNLH
jgi:hypothetical protein